MATLRNLLSINEDFKIEKALVAHHLTVMSRIERSYEKS